MINASELRLGNWLQLDGNSTTIDQMDFEQWTFDYCEPIPLTPEILEKCGFRMLGNFYMNRIVLSPCMNGFLYAPRGENGDTKTLITAVHQLQNLYFALTNTELEISL